MITITFFGNASNKIYKELQIEANQEISLLDLAQTHNVPIASSCLGKGHCLKCMANNESVILCQVKVSDLDDGKHYTYYIDYL